MRTSAQRAAALIRHYAGSSDPDNRTSMADARIALCLARGVDMDDIDPASGYDYSRSAYDRCRQSWVSNIKYHGYSVAYEGAALTRAIANWTARRPDFIAGDDWLAVATDAHRTYWAGLGRACSRSTCDLHATAEEDGPVATGSGPGAQDSLFDELPHPRRRAITDVPLPA